jgi:O-antigen ligase
MPDFTNKPYKIIQQLFYVLFFLTPLILWPFTSEVFEFNKMIFVYLMTVLIASAWAIMSFSNKKFVIAKTPLDIPILLFLTSQIISTIISINPHTSLWGYYSRFHGGLVSTISYITLYYALVTHFSNQPKAIKNLITAILSSAAIVSVYAVLERLGIDKNVWVQDVQNRVFSTLGQPNWLSAFLVAILPLSLFQATRSKNNSNRLIYLGLSLLYLSAIAFTKSQSGIGATFVILLMFFIISSIQNKKTWLLLTLVPLFAIIIIFKGPSIQLTLSSLNKINPFYSDTNTIIKEENKTRIGGSDSMAIRRVVWEGAIKLGLQRPFFGTGVETFGYSYYWVRPAAHNLTSEADFLYNKAHNEYLNFFATTGFVGLATYLLLIAFISNIYLKNWKTEPNISQPLFLGFISILITNYFGFSVVNIALFFFLCPAIVLASSDQVQIIGRKLKLDSTFGYFLVFCISIWLLLGLRRMWAADIAYNKGKQSLEESQKAVTLNPHEPIYYAQLGSINALVASQVIAPQIAELPASASADIKKQANSFLEKYVNSAIDNINKAQQLNPYNLNIIKTKAKTEITLATINPQLYQDALNSLLKVTELSPTESSNFQNVGILYQNLGNIDMAKVAFERAIELNPESQTAKDYLDNLSK